MPITVCFTGRLQMTILLFLFPVFGLSPIMFFNIFIAAFLVNISAYSFISRIFFTSFFSKKINMFITVCFTRILQVTILFLLFVVHDFVFSSIYFNKNPVPEINEELGFG